MRIAVFAALLAAWPVLALAQDATNTTSKPVAGTATSTAAATSTATSEAADEAAQHKRALDFYNSLHRQTGVIAIAHGKVTLNVPETHYFVGPEDARRIICDVWGNPPEAAQGVDGMIFPAGANPAEGSWGAVLQYSSDGHVSDGDARTTDYAKLLRDMQQQARDENAHRRANHFDEIAIVGWAEPPRYDPVQHELYWAKELNFSSMTEHTLNYDIRVLGREGYLIVSFVSRMSELPTIRQNIPTMLAIPRFTPGNTYADYREGVDPRAAYGIAGLIAGGTVAAVAQKTGLLALILAFGKKFIILIIAGFAAIGRFFQRMFAGRKTPPPGDDANNNT